MRIYTRSRAHNHTEYSDRWFPICGRLTACAPTRVDDVTEHKMENKTYARPIAQLLARLDAYTHIQA